MKRKMILIPLIALMVISAGILSGCQEKQQDKNPDDDFANWVVDVYTINGVYWDELSLCLYEADIEKGMNTSDEWLEYLRVKLNEINETDYTVLSEDMNELYWNFSDVLTESTLICIYFKMACQSALDNDDDGFNYYSRMLVSIYISLAPTLTYCKQVLERNGYI